MDLRGRFLRMRRAGLRLRHALAVRARNPAVILAVTLAALILLVLGALFVHGVDRRAVQVDDGSIWITSQNERKVARFKPDIGEADVALSTGTDHFDLAQSGYAVILGREGGMAPIAAATAALGDTTRSDARVQRIINGPTLVLFQARTGRIWVGQAASPGNLDTQRRDPVLTLGSGAAVTVDASGVVYAYRPSDGVVLRIDGPDSRAHRELDSLTGHAPIRATALSVIDGRPVLLAGDRLYWPQGSVRIPHRGDLQLQSTPVDMDRQGPWAGLTDQESVHLVELDHPKNHIETVRTGGSGQPAQPVSSGGCLWTAWASSGRNFLRLCATGKAVPQVRSQQPHPATLEAISPTSDLVFRANHRRVILNDVLTGDVWNPRSSTKVIRPQWQTMEIKHADSNDQRQDSADNRQRFAATCRSGSQPIQAEDDSLGIRAGSRALLDPLRNDRQTDCSVLRIEDARSSQGNLRLTPVMNGRYLQVDASDAPDGRARINYSITDGRGQVSSAGIDLNIAPAKMDQGDQAPVQNDTPPEYEVEQGATTTVNALSGFEDPEGDPLTLVGAESVNSDRISLSTRADGQLTMSAGSATSGRLAVKVTVSDGLMSGQGLIYFTVRPVNTLAPLVDPVIRQAAPGREVTVDLSRSVHANAARPLRLVQVDKPDGIQVEVNAESLSFTATAANPGTYYVPYRVAQGDQETQGLVRLEAERNQSGSAPPVPVNDVALLGADQTAIVDPLDNDLDPMGGVLALTDVRVDPNSGIKVGIVDHRRIYLSARKIPARPLSIAYTVANANGSAQGTIVLQPPSLNRAASAPKAPNLTVGVRSSGLVTVSVMDKVTHADGTSVTLDQKLTTDQRTFAGLAFVSGDTVRYQASERTGDFPATYTVRDDLGNAASGTITFRVHASDASNKPAPTPKDLRAQVAAGTKVRIPVPLTGIDPDGDCDTLSGLGNQVPKLGRIVKAGADYLIYEAYPDSHGTDEFTYAVEDWVGQRAQARIRIGVFPDSSVTGVFARDDKVRLRPGTVADVPVLLNDISGDDDPLSLGPHLERQGLDQASVEDGMIRLTAPSQPGTSYLVYQARNQAGLSDQATLTVVSDPQAPIQPPIAQDYQVAPEDTVDKRSVEVNLADSISNPSGTLDDLRLGIHPEARAHARTVGEAGSAKLVIDLTDQARAVPYTVTNTRYNITSMAFVKVPAYGVFPPVLRPRAPALKVRAGQSITIDIADQVRVGAGKTARIVSRQSVSATKSDGSDPYVDEHTLKFTAARDYAGPASLTFAVRDGDPGGQAIINESVLTLPITVVGGKASPPVLSEPVIDLVAGDPAQTISLTAMTRWPQGSDPADGTFSAGDPQGPIHASLSPRGQLNVAADKTATSGTKATLPVTITSSSGNAHTVLAFRIVATTRPLASVPSRQVGLKAGQSVELNLFEGALNPFPDTPLRLLGLVSDDASRLTATNLGNGRIAIKADRDIGASTNTILATVEDGSRDPGRRVTATITVGIIDRPQAPRMLAGAAQAGDGTVLLAWEPGAVNGSPVDEYRVSYTSAAGSGQRSCGNAVTCRIYGLSNGHDYSFTVQAHNQVGWSPASSPAAARPDALPGGVQALTVNGDSKEILTVTWRAPENHGSPIQSYTVHGEGSGCGSPRWRAANSTNAVFDVSHDEAGGTCTVSVTPANMAGSGPVASAAGSTWSHPDPPAFQTLEYLGNNQVKLVLNPGAEHGRPCADIQVDIEGIDPDKASWTLPCNQQEVSETITLPAGSAKPGATLNFRAVARIHGVGSEGHSPSATKELTLPKETDKPSDKTLRQRSPEQTRINDHG